MFLNFKTIIIEACKQDTQLVVKWIHKRINLHTLKHKHITALHKIGKRILGSSIWVYLHFVTVDYRTHEEDQMSFTHVSDSVK